VGVGLTIVGDDEGEIMAEDETEVEIEADIEVNAIALTELDGYDDCETEADSEGDMLGSRGNGVEAQGVKELLPLL